MLLWMYELVSIFVWVWNMNVVGRNSGEVWHTRPSEPVSPRRHLQEQIRATLELSLRQKPLFWARHYLAQARDARLREDTWELWACCSCFSPGEEPHLWARGCRAQVRRARLSEPCESLPMPLSRSRLSKGPPPKRGHSSRLSEDSWLEQDLLRVVLFPSLG